MSRTITIGHLTVFAEEAADHPATRPPILYVPGYFAGAWVFSGYLAYFAGRGYAGYAVNLRGRGGSALPSGALLGRVSLSEFVADALEAAAWIEARAGKPIVVGHSMGGLVAQRVAELGHARALVLVASAPPRGISLLSTTLLRRQIRYLPALARSRRVVPRFEDMSALVLNRVPAADRAALFAQLVPDSGRAGREMTLGRLRVDAKRLLDQDCPVLVLGADDDRFIPLRVARKLAARYHAPLYVAREHGHMLLVEPGWETAAGFIADWLAHEA